MKALHKAALAYARQGWRIFPCRPGTKVPVERDSFYNASADPDQINDWWEENPEYNIGFEPGSSDMMTLDFDPGADEETLADRTPTHLIVDTPRGRHEHYKLFEDDEPVRNSASAEGIGEHVDVRSSGGYTLLPPSALRKNCDGKGHPGGQYTWAEEGEAAYRDDFVYEAAFRKGKDRSEDWNEWIIDADQPKHIKQAKAWLNDPNECKKFCISGKNGNQVAYETACMMRSFGLSMETAAQVMAESQWNLKRNQPPWEEAELLETEGAAIGPGVTAYVYPTSAPGNMTMAYQKTKHKKLFQNNGGSGPRFPVACASGDNKRLKNETSSEPLPSSGQTGTSGDNKRLKNETSSEPENRRPTRKPNDEPLNSSENKRRKPRDYGDGDDGGEEDPPNGMTDTTAEYQKYRMLKASEAFNLPDIRWLIPGVLPEKGYGILFGAPGTHKTFISLALAMSVAMGGQPVNKRKGKGSDAPKFAWPEVSEGGPVLYAAGEGRYGIGKRLQAWAKVHQVPAPPWNDFIIAPVPDVAANNGFDLEDLEEFVEHALSHHQSYKLLVIDTVSRAMAGLNESSAQDATRFSKTVDILRETLGCAVLAIHHTGHDENSAHARGSSSFGGDADITMKLKPFKTSEGIVMAIDTAKPPRDSAEWEKPIYVQMHRTKLNPDGPESDSNTSLAATAASPAALKEATRPVPDKKKEAAFDLEDLSDCVMVVLEAAPRNEEFSTNGVVEQILALKDAPECSNATLARYMKELKGFECWAHRVVKNSSTGTIVWKGIGLS